MTIQECIDKVDAVQTNSFTVTQKVEWLSALDGNIIDDVLKTHDGYNGMYDSFSGYSDSNLTVSLVVQYPYDKLYVSYLRMMIDYHNGDIKRYNNSAALYNADYMDYVKYYNKTHIPIFGNKKAPAKIPHKDVTDAEIEQIIKQLTYNMTEYFSNKLSDDKIADVVTKFVQNNLAILKGKDGYTPKKGVDYLTEGELRDFKVALDAKVEKVPGKGLSSEDFTKKHKTQIEHSKGAYVFMGSVIGVDFLPYETREIPDDITPVYNYIGEEVEFTQPRSGEKPYILHPINHGIEPTDFNESERAFFDVPQNEAVIFYKGLRLVIYQDYGAVVSNVFKVSKITVGNNLYARVYVEDTQKFSSLPNRIECSPTIKIRHGDNVAVFKVAEKLFYEVLSHDYGEEIKELQKQISTGGGSVDLSKYATIQYVDEQIGQALDGDY